MSAEEKFIFFYFPCTGPGGIQSIIIRLLIEGLEFNKRIFLIDKSGSYLQDQIKRRCPEAWNSNVIIVNSITEFIFPSNSCLIVFNWQLPLLIELKSNSKKFLDYLYWDVHSASIKQAFSIRLLNMNLYQFDAGKILKNLSMEDRLLTIDKVSEHYIQQLANEKISLLVTGIPVQAESASEIDNKRMYESSRDSINIVYIGRAVDWKVYPFIFAVKSLKVKYKKTIRIRIYTDSIVLFKKFIVDGFLDYQSIQFFEGYSVSEIISRDRDWVTLSVGMGTSQFELFFLGVPTLLIPATTSADILRYVEPMWVHLMPEYVFGFDDESIATISSIGDVRHAMISESNFEWSPSQLLEVSKSASDMKRIYSPRFILGLIVHLLRKDRFPDSFLHYSYELGVIYSWQRVVLVVKNFISRILYNK